MFRPATGSKSLPGLAPALSRCSSVCPGRRFIAGQPCSGSVGILWRHLQADAFSCRIFLDQGLSGSVQWQCIRSGSGKVQLFTHARRPNHCGYTTKHNVERNINSKTSASLPAARGSGFGRSIHRFGPLALERESHSLSLDDFFHRENEERNLTAPFAVTPRRTRSFSTSTPL